MNGNNDIILCEEEIKNMAEVYCQRLFHSDNNHSFAHPWQIRDVKPIKHRNGTWSIRIGLEEKGSNG